MNAVETEADGSPYQDQIARGFGLLHFSDVLQAEFQATTYSDRLVQIRQTVSAVAVFVLVMLVSDLIFSSAGFSHPVVPVQGFISLALLAFLFWLARRRTPSRKALAITGVLLGLNFGYVNLLVNIWIAPTATVVAPDLAYVCGTFFIFFCFGLRFWQAVLLSMLLFLGYLTYVAGTVESTAASVYPILFLAFSNVFSAFGLYNMEYNQRNLFLQSNKLKYAAEHDQLTGLLNRRAMKALLRRVWAHCLREKLPLSLAVVGLDCFRDYIVQYGQKRADECLLQVARLLETCVQRPLDFVACYSSEEFVLVLPGCNPENAMIVLTRLQEELVKLYIEYAASSVSSRLTFSIGLLATDAGTKHTDVESLLQKADAAVYEADRKGGNTIVAYPCNFTDGIKSG